MTISRSRKFASHGFMLILLVWLAGPWFSNQTCAAAAADQPANASLSGFYLPGFGMDGYKSWDIQGRDSQAASAESTQIEISDLLLRIFSGGKNSSLEMSIKSAHATVTTANSETQVKGSDILYITGANDSYSVTGYDWVWSSSTHTISLGRSAAVTFTSAATGHSTIILSDTLKIAQQPETNQFSFKGNVSVSDRESQGNPSDEFHTTCNELEVLATRASANTTTSKAASGDVPPVRSGESTAPVASLAVGSIQSIVANNNVVSRQGAIEARGGQADISPADNKVVLSNSPQIRVILSGNTADSTNYALIEGGRINWLRDRQEINVDPTTSPGGTLGRVKVTLPSNSAPPPGESEARLSVTGETLHAQFGLQQRRFDIEKSVRVEDPKYTIEAQHLDAEFDPPDASAPSDKKTEGIPPATIDNKKLTTDKPVPQLGKLNHLAVTGGVTLFQTNLKATTPQAEILPADDTIFLSGGAQVVDTLSNATIDANTIKLSTDGKRATVQGAEDKPAHLLLPSLPLGENGGQNIATDVLSKNVVMERGPEYSNFTFSGNVEVNASSLKMTSGQLDATTLNTQSPAESDPTKRVQIARLFAHDHVLITQPGFKARAASAEVNPQAGFSQNPANGSSTGAGKDYRLVQLHGDPTGATGPVRPEVEVPLQDMNPGMVPGDKAAGPTATTAKITSDEQWLFTSPTTNTYVFMDNVAIDVGNPAGRIFMGTCERMQVNCTQVQTPSPAAPNSGATRLAVDNIVAERNVRIVQGDQGQSVSTADRAVIMPREDKAVLSGNAVVVDNAKGSRLQNADITLMFSNGQLSEGIDPAAPAAPGQPIQRPTFSLPASALHLDEIKKATEKDSNSPAR